MLRAPEPVLMLIADISGYTAYLAGTEIDHAQNVLEDLLETVHARLVPPFALIKAEGDALFLFAETGSVSGSMLLDGLDACYFAFRRRLRDVTQATTCECNACVLIPRLNLKFVVHAGQAVRQTAFGVLDLVGSDVVLVHRLLKNHVVEEHGWHGYGLLTDAAIQSVGLDCLRLGMVAHRETYEDAGPVIGFVEDLESRWREEEARSTLRLAPAEAKWRFDVDLPATPPEAWEWITSPRLRPRWATHIVRVDQETTDGRAGVGTMNHCIHGRDAVLEEVLDWRPFESTTVRSATPIGSILTTFDFAPIENGTRVTALCGTGELKGRLLWPVVKRALDERFGAGLTRLRQILEDDPAGSAA